jgi:NTP pyrophosphatase (non-canonical NTP hydrolase)
MDINEIADRQHEWLCRVGWMNATPLEDLALIASEVGEAVNECRGEKPTQKLGTELADIVLRTLGMARKLNIDIAADMEAKMALNEHRGTRGRVI